LPPSRAHSRHQGSRSSSAALSLFAAMFEKRQAPKSTSAAVFSRHMFEVYCLRFGTSLVIGVWCFPRGHLEVGIAKALVLVSMRSPTSP
jgi:hypothetical protein